MSVVHAVFPSRANGVEIVEDARDIRIFRETATGATIWRRALPRENKTWQESIPEARLPRGRVILRRHDLHHALTQLCDIFDTPKGQTCDWLINDIAVISGTFADLVGADHVRLRLDVVTGNACRKFHVDAVHSRLICTYRGPGAQYGNAQAGHDPARVFSVPTGDAILLLGALWRESPHAELLHRSPPMAGRGEARLVLVVDPVFDPEEVG